MHNDRPESSEPSELHAEKLTDAHSVLTYAYLKDDLPSLIIIFMTDIIISSVSPLNMSVVMYHLLQIGCDKL